MGIYIHLTETVNGRTHKIAFGKYGLNGLELLFNEKDHVGNGVFNVSGADAITNVQKVLGEISDKANEFSNLSALSRLREKLTSITLNPNAAYRADFSEYFACEQENKDYDPACIITERKRHLENDLAGYSEFGIYGNTSADEFSEKMENLPGIRSAFCSFHGKDNIVFSVSVQCTEKDREEFTKTHQFVTDYFFQSFNKRRLFFILKNQGLNEFSLLDKNSETFYVSITRSELQKWLMKTQNQSLDAKIAMARGDRLERNQTNKKISSLNIPTPDKNIER